MYFTDFNTYLSFNYAGKPFAESAPSLSETRDGDIVTRILSFSDGLRVTTTVKKLDGFDAYDWVSYFENTGDADTALISDILDADVILPMPHTDGVPYTAFFADDDAYTWVHSPIGSVWALDEFYAKPARLDAGQSHHCSTSGGRSSQAKAPFFHVTYKGESYIFAIGWTGQWKCDVARGNDAVVIKTGLENTAFVLHPGEKIRTSSFVILHAQGQFCDTQNTWRRLIRAHYSQIGTEGREALPPFCTGLWGGMSTKGALDRIKAIKEHNLPFEYIWMDAGWYGTWTGESPDEFVGEWGGYTGDWRVNPHPHPDGLQDVVRAVKDAGKKFLLWFEPERITSNAPIWHDHPEYILGGTLLNLGDEEVWQYCYDTLAESIERLQIDCYRQDFNMDPLSFWQNNDAENRCGITEIKHIMGMYRLWDALLERFPHLIIDNCSSGGRRIDIETLRRSVPLWRSDFQCPANYKPIASQTHAAGFGTWMPFSGTGHGRIWQDTYRFRSAFAPGMTTNFFFSERDPISENPDDYAWLQRMCEEYLRCRRYLTRDIYPLTQYSDMEDTWFAVQYHDPDDDTGIVQAFRRPQSDYTEAYYRLHGLIPDKQYTLTDADTDETITCSGAVLMNEGLRIAIPQKHMAKLFYLK